MLYCVLFVHGVGEQPPRAPEAFFARLRRIARTIAAQIMECSCKSG